MSGVRMLHLFKDWWKFIQIPQYYTMTLNQLHSFFPQFIRRLIKLVLKRCFKSLVKTISQEIFPCKTNKGICKCASNILTKDYDPTWIHSNVKRGKVYTCYRFLDSFLVYMLCLKVNFTEWILHRTNFIIASKINWSELCSFPLHHNPPSPQKWI